MNLSPHISLAEFTASETAARRGIDNTLPPELLSAAMETARMLERIRDHLSARAGFEVAVVVTSGYRCQALNRAIGSADSSDHVRACAADFKAPGFGTPYEVAKSLAPHISTLGIGQLIHEFGAWVHVSTRLPDKQINRIITITGRGTEVGILPP